MRIIFCSLLALVSSLCFGQKLSPAKTQFDPSEDIVVAYSGVPRPNGNNVYIISLAGKDDAYNNISTMSYVRDFPEGSVKFYAPYREAEYVLRLLLYTDLSDLKPKLIHEVAIQTRRKGQETPPQKSPQQPVSSTGEKPGAQEKPAPSNPCATAVPVTTGKKVAGAPQPEEVAAILRGMFQNVYAPGHLQPKDVCVEFGPMNFLPQTTRKILNQWNHANQAALPAWPVKVTVTIRIPRGKETEIVQRGTGKETFFFYRDEKKQWAMKSGDL